MPERGLWCLTHDFVLAMGLLTGEKKFMRTAFIGMLLGIGLMFLAASSGGPQCYPVESCPGLYVLMMFSMELLILSTIVWVRLTILAWIIHFGARQWYTGKGQHYEENLA